MVRFFKFKQLRVESHVAEESERGLEFSLSLFLFWKQKSLFVK